MTRILTFSLCSIVLLALLSLSNGCASSTNALYLDETGARSGELIVKRQCIRCHGLYSPKHYTDAEWRSIIDDMASEAHLNEQDTQLVLDYMLAHN